MCQAANHSTFKIILIDQSYSIGILGGDSKKNSRAKNCAFFGVLSNVEAFHRIVWMRAILPGPGNRSSYSHAAHMAHLDKNPRVFSTNGGQFFSYLKIHLWLFLRSSVVRYRADIQRRGTILAWIVILSVFMAQPQLQKSSCWSLPFCADLLIYEINSWVSR